MYHLNSWQTVFFKCSSLFLKKEDVIKKQCMYFTFKTLYHSLVKYFSCLYFTSRQHVTSSLTLSLIHYWSEQEWCGSTGISSTWCKALWQLSGTHTENKWNVGACCSKINKRQAHIKAWVVGCVEVVLLESCL